MATFTMTQVDEFGERVTKSYTCLDGGGYIYFGEDVGGSQVCEGLSYVGNTLRAETAAELPAIIRRERRRQLRQERRDGLR